MNSAANTNLYYDISELLFIFNKIVKKDCKLYTIDYINNKGRVELHETGKNSLLIIEASLPEILNKLVSMQGDIL